MHENPAHWRDYYSGTAAEQDVLLFNSYSDRIRYYWPDRRIEAATAKLVANLTTAPAPDMLLSRYLPSQYRRVRNGELSPDPQALILDRIRDATPPLCRGMPGLTLQASSGGKSKLIRSERKPRVRIAP